MDREKNKMKRQRNVFQAKEGGKTSAKDLNGREVNNLPNGFGVLVIKMLIKLRKRMNE